MFCSRSSYCYISSTAIILLTFLIFYSNNWHQLSYSQPFQTENGNGTFLINNISYNERDSVYPQTESYGNNVYVTWQDNLFGNNRQNYEILLKTSSDGGKTFGDVINLSNNAGFSEHPQMAVNGSNVYIVWADNTKLNRDIYLISSSDGGKTFGDAINLSNNTADSYNQEISVSGNNVYVTWLDSQKNVQGNSTISFISSSDGGETFGDITSLSNNAVKSSFPKISSFADNVYVGWNVDNQAQSPIEGNQTDNNNTKNNTPQEGIFFVKSTDNGVTFDEEVQINSEAEPGEIQMAANNNSVYALWGSPDPSTTTIYESDMESKSEATSLEADDGDIPGIEGDGVYFVKSTDNGQSFTQPFFIKAPFQNPLNVEIIEHSGELFMTIQATPIEDAVGENQDIYFMMSPDDGNTFTSAINISNNHGISECPSLTVLSGKEGGNDSLFVVWQDKSPGNNEALSTTISLTD